MKKKMYVTHFYQVIALSRMKLENYIGSTQYIYIGTYNICTYSAVWKTTLFTLFDS